LQHTQLGAWPVIGFNANLTTSNISTGQNLFSPVYNPTTGGILEIDCAGEGFTHAWYNWNGNSTAVSYTAFTQIWRADRNGIHLYSGELDNYTGILTMGASGQQLGLNIGYTTVGSTTYPYLYPDSIRTYNGAGGLGSVGSGGNTSKCWLWIDTLSLYCNYIIPITAPVTIASSGVGCQLALKNTNANYTFTISPGDQYSGGNILGFGNSSDWALCSMDSSGNWLALGLFRTFYGETWYCYSTYNAYVAQVQAANNWISGAAAGDFVIRNDSGTLWFTANYSANCVAINSAGSILVLGNAGNSAIGFGGSANIGGCAAGMWNAQSATYGGLVFLSDDWSYSPQFTWYGSRSGTRLMSLDSSGNLRTTNIYVGGSLTFNYSTPNVTIGWGSQNLNGYTSGYIYPTHACVQNGSVWDQGVGLGCSSYFWNWVDSAYFYGKNTTIIAMDDIDDLGLVKAYKTKKIGNKIVVDMQSMPHLTPDDPLHKDFYDSGKIFGYTLGCHKAAALKLDEHESMMANLSDQLQQLKDKITALQSIVDGGEA
jgi:hypothetical protein